MIVSPRGRRWVQVGMGLGVSARYVRTLSDKMTGRVVARAGMSGIELEIGANRRISQFSTAGMSVSVGLMVRAHTAALEAPKQPDCTYLCG